MSFSKKTSVREANSDESGVCSDELETNSDE
jgi:hypothetical protein